MRRIKGGVVFLRKYGEWIEPMPQEGHRLICSDCGLIYSVDFRVVNNRAQFRVRRDEEATKNWRWTRNAKA